MPKKDQKELPPLKDIPLISEAVAIAIKKLETKKELSESEDELLLSPVETAAVLSTLKGSEVSVRYLPQMIRDGRLEPDSQGGGRMYRYKLGKVRQIKFRPAGRPKTD